MRLHIKNILAGVGTGAVVVLLAVLSIMSFASVSGNKVPGSITIIKDVVPDSDRNYSPHEYIDFQFRIYADNGANIFSSSPIDDDGDNTNDHTNTAIHNTLEIPDPGSATFKIVESQFNNHFSYNTKWECYVDGGDPNQSFAHGFGVEAEITLDKDRPNVTCKFTNTLTDATLIINKDIQPDSSELVGFNIFTENMNQLPGNGYAYFKLGDNDSKTVKIVSGTKYTISEDFGPKSPLKSPWLKYATTYSCSNGQSGSLPYFDLNPLSSGETVECNFVNTKNKEVIIRKITDPVDLNSVFEFEVELIQSGTTWKWSQDNPKLKLKHGEFLNPSFYFDNDLPWQLVITEDDHPIYGASYSCDLYGADGTKYDTKTGTGPRVEVSLGASEKADCTFINKIAKITIKKDVRDENGNDIESDAGEIFEIESEKTRQSFVLDDNASTDPTPPNSFTIDNVNAGVDYKFTETDTNNDLSVKYNTSWTCDDGSGNSGRVMVLNIKKGEQITCTFVNTRKPPTIIYIKKDVVNYLGQDIEIPDDFNFKYVKNGSDVPFTLDDDSADSTYSNIEKVIVKPGVSYTFEEFLTSGQKYNVSWVCTDVNQKSGNDTSIEAPILGEGESITCTMTNKELQKATIHVLKDATPLTNDVFIFNVLQNGNLVDVLKAKGNGTIDPNLKQETKVNAGTYTIEESLQTNGKAYTTTYICEFLPSRKPGNDLVGTGRFINDITLAPGESVGCNFFNVEAAKVVITKSTFPTIVNENFEIEVKSNNEPAFTLNPQTRPQSGEIGVESEKPFTISENLTSAQIDKYDTSWSCDDGTSGNSRNINVAKVSGGATLKCTFTNKIKPTITVIKKTTPAILDQWFTVNMVQGIKTWILKYNTGQGQASYTNSVKVQTGLTITENQESGITTTWICSDGRKGNGVGPINVSGMDYGAKLTCTFTNCKGTAGSLCPSYPDPDGDHQ